MGQETLREWQKKVIGFVASAEALQDFYLTGGTALAAYYLHHRASDDLDFFCFADIDSITIKSVAEKIGETLGASRVRFSRLYDRNQFFYETGDEEYKVEFTKYPFPQLHPPEIFDGLRVDSEFDIAVNKLMTILDRFDPKDFVDLYFLLSRFSLPDLRQGVEKKFRVTIDPVFLGSALTNVKRVKALPRMITPLSVEQLIDFFAAEAKRLRSEVIE
jgi:predicted nucleotidyltransferase component of viral defense system